MNLLRRKWPFFGDHGGPPPVGPPRFGAWGKLPVFGDYQGWPGQGPASPAATGYTKWIKDGWESVGGIMGPTTVASSQLWCRSAERNDCITAQIWHSRDSIGQLMARPFPFTCFVSETDVAPSWAARVARITSVWQTLDDVRLQFERIISPDRFENICREAEQRLNLDAPPSFETNSEGVLGDMSLRTFGQAILGQVDERQVCRWIARTHRLLHRCSELATARDQLAIACPTARGIPLTAQLLAWLYWLSATVDMQPQVLLAPVQQDPDVPGSVPERIVICFRELTDVDLLLFTTRAAEYACLKPISTAPPEGEEAADEEEDLDIDAPLTTWAAAQAAQV